MKIRFKFFLSGCHDKPAICPAEPAHIYGEADGQPRQLGRARPERYAAWAHMKVVCGVILVYVMAYSKELYCREDHVFLFTHPID
jgi:hypothetical protein